jgi:hypothetical protein
VPSDRRTIERSKPAETIGVAANAFVIDIAAKAMRGARHRIGPPILAAAFCSMVQQGRGDVNRTWV